MNATITIESCVECGHHREIPDPDPYDSFCSDDVAVVCSLVTNPSPKQTEYLADRSKFKTITVSCRPYNTKKETPVPDWCPKRA